MANPQELTAEQFMAGQEAPPVTAEEFMQGKEVSQAPAPSAKPPKQNQPIPSVSTPVVQNIPEKPEAVEPVLFPVLTTEAFASYLKDNRSTPLKEVEQWLKNEYGLSSNNLKEVIGYFRNRGSIAPVPEYQPSERPQTVSGDVSVSAAPPRGWFDRMSDKAGEMFDEAGEGVNAIFLRGNQEHREEELIRYWASQNNLSGEELEAELTRNDDARARAVKERRTQIAMRDEDEARRDPSLGGKISRLTSDLAGGLVGDINPTYALAPGASALTRIGSQGAINAATDVAVQADELDSGIQEEYDVGRTGMNFLMGAAFQGSAESFSKLAPKVSDWFRSTGSRNADNQGSVANRQELEGLEADLNTLERYGLDAENFTTPEAISRAANRARSAERRGQTEDAPTVEGEAPAKADVVSRFEEELRNVRPSRKAQDKLTSEFRSTQASGLSKALNEGTGSSAFFNGLSELKGSANRVDYESLADKFTQKDVEELSEILRTSDVFGSSNFDRLNAFKGLQKLLGEGGAEIPTPSELNLLSKVFDPEVVRGLMKARPLKNRVTDALGNALGLPRSLMSTADLSAPLRQGAFLIRRKEFAEALPEMLKAAASEKGYRNIMDDIASRPTYDLMQESRLGITDMDGNLSQREEDFMSNWGEKIPVAGRVVRGSNRAYSGFLNKLRADTFDTFVRQAAERGNDVTKSPKDLEAISAYVNAATGRGNLPKWLENYAPALNATLFSPRLISSRLNLLGNPTLYTKLPKGVRREALKDFLGYASTAATVLSLATAGGMAVSTNPTSSDFLKIKDGDTRYDVLGGFQQYMRLTATLLSESRTTARGDEIGPESESFEDRIKFALENLVRFSRSKLSPNASYGVDAYVGSNMIGEDFDAVDDAASRLFPLFLQDLGDMIVEEGPEGAWKVLPGLFGVSVSSYPTPNDRFGRMADPSREETNPAALEVNRLSETLGEGKSLVGYVNKGQLKKFEATDEQVNAYQELSGKYILDSIQELQFSGAWDKMSDAERIEEVRGISRDMREVAREELFPEYYGEEAEAAKEAFEEEAAVDDRLPAPRADSTFANSIASDLLVSELGLELTDYGTRPRADQERYFRQAGGRGVSAPGTSSHEFGNAVDVRTPPRGVTTSQVTKLMEDNGFYGVRIITRTHGTGPHWHIEWEGVK